MSNKTMVEFEKLYREYSDNIFRVCIMMLGDCQLAEDAAQETFCRAMSKYRSFRRGSSPKTWLTRIAINICKDRLKRRSNLEIPVEIIDAASRSEEDIDGRLSVLSAVEALPINLREVVTLYYYQEFTQKEIAKILGLSEPNVAYRLRSARKLLRNHLTEEDYE